MKRSENLRLYGQNKLLSFNPALQPYSSFSHKAASRSSSENTGRMSLIPVFNKKFPQAHTKLEIDVLGVQGKLVKYVVQLLKLENKKLEKNKKIFFIEPAKPATNWFLLSRNFRG
jgi:hypothetical protein